MHGGLKVYHGAAAAARHYVEADRSRADDYYLPEGSGIAMRFTAGLDELDQRVLVERRADMDGDAYEKWVAGIDLEIGRPKGRLRKDDQAVRFVEVTVNGPKTWSLAAALHQDVAAAYDAAQMAAAKEIIGWLAEHSTTRVGPRGRQVQVPVERIEAAVVRHFTSRAGDPHRHLHLQINAPRFGFDRLNQRSLLAWPSHRRRTRQPRGHQRHRPRGRDDQPGVPSGPRSTRLHARS